MLILFAAIFTLKLKSQNTKKSRTKCIMGIVESQFCLQVGSFQAFLPLYH